MFQSCFNHPIHSQFLSTSGPDLLPAKHAPVARRLLQCSHRSHALNRCPKCPAGPFFGAHGAAKSLVEKLEDSIHAARAAWSKWAPEPTISGSKQLGGFLAWAAVQTPAALQSLQTWQQSQQCCPGRCPCLSQKAATKHQMLLTSPRRRGEISIRTWNGRTRRTLPPWAKYWTCRNFFLWALLPHLICIRQKSFNLW